MAGFRGDDLRLPLLSQDDSGIDTSDCPSSVASSTAYYTAAEDDSSKREGHCCDGSRSVIKCISAEETDSNFYTNSQQQQQQHAFSATEEDKGCSVLMHTCLAVIRPDETAVDVYDAKGRARTFCIKDRGRNKKDTKLPMKKLCFSTHGAGGDIDGMLTHCFDRNGEHGKPEKRCSCGLDEPHLHAHNYIPEVCGAIDDGSSWVSGAVRKKATDLRFLSRVTFHIDDISSSPYMSTSESMPNECNSEAIQNYLDERGLKLSDWKKNQSHGDGCKRPRLYPIRHGDHTDFLIHNETNGELYMEHPNKCGKSDIHGRFQLAHTRSWMVDKGSKINLHFFKVHGEPFCLLDVLNSLFPSDLDSNRVDDTNPVNCLELRHDISSPVVSDIARETAASSRVSKSEFFFDSAQTLEFDSDSFESVVGDSVAPTTKTDDGDDVSFKKDGAVVMDQMVGIPTDIYVISRFELIDVLGRREADKEAVAYIIRASLDQKFSTKHFKNVAVNREKNILTVEHNPCYLTAFGIADVLSSPLNDVIVISDGGADGTWALPSTDEDTVGGTVEETVEYSDEDSDEDYDEGIIEGTVEDEKPNLPWFVVLSGVCLIISMLSFIGGNWLYLEGVALLSVTFGLPPTAIKALRTLCRCHFDVNCMMLVASIGALSLQKYIESAAVTFLFAISEALETWATSRARNALSAILCLRPEHANVINPATNEIVVLPASAVAVGTLVSVRTGDMIPCDGIVMDGTSTIDESSLTGERWPVEKSLGMRVSGGAINTGNMQLVIKTTATSNNSAVSKLIRLVEEAQSNRSDTEKLVESFAGIYSPVAVLAALCMCTIPWTFGAELGTTWVYNGLVTIIIACPTALIISTPVTYVAGLVAAAQKGVLVKGGQHLERLGRTKSIIFDKTGTLSRGVFALLYFNNVGQTRSRKEVFEYLALMEAPSDHPLSDAIVQGAANEQIDIPKLQLKCHRLLPGEGITANVAGKDVHVGNKKLFRRLSMYQDLEEHVKISTGEWERAGGTAGFISIEGEGIVGIYCVADKTRDGAQDVVKALKKMGIGIIMLSGGQRPTAIALGSQVGLEEQDIKSELLPEDKMIEISNAIKENEMKKKCWNAKRVVMMVGDGVNNAPASALVDVPVAMGEGAVFAMDTADVTLMGSNLNKLQYIICMGRRVIRTIIENIIFSLVVKAVVLGFAYAGKAYLWVAVVSEVGAMLIVTLNGMKLLPKSTKKTDLALGSPQETAPEIEAMVLAMW